MHLRPGAHLFNVEDQMLLSLSSFPEGMAVRLRVYISTRVHAEHSRDIAYNRNVPEETASTCGRHVKLSTDVLHGKFSFLVHGFVVSSCSFYLHDNSPHQ